MERSFNSAQFIDLEDYRTKIEKSWRFAYLYSTLFFLIVFLHGLDVFVFSSRPHGLRDKAKDLCVVNDITTWYRLLHQNPTYSFVFFSQQNLSHYASYFAPQLSNKEIAYEINRKFIDSLTPIDDCLPVIIQSSSDRKFSTSWTIIHLFLNFSFRLFFQRRKDMN